MVPNPRKELFLNLPGEKRKNSQSEQRKQACFGMAAWKDDNGLGSKNILPQAELFVLIREYASE